MRVIIQEEKTGCGIAAVANITQRSYAGVKAKANHMGIYASDVNLYSQTHFVRKLLSVYGLKTLEAEIPFTSWDELPSLALLSLKYRIENGVPLWHWVVFKRLEKSSVVLDSASYLEENIRTDFNIMKPAWYIDVT